MNNLKNKYFAGVTRRRLKNFANRVSKCFAGDAHEIGHTYSGNKRIKINHKLL